MYLALEKILLTVILPCKKLWLVIQTRTNKMLLFFVYTTIFIKEVSIVLLLEFLFIWFYFKRKHKYTSKQMIFIFLLHVAVFLLSGLLGSVFSLGPLLTLPSQSMFMYILHYEIYESLPILWSVKLLIQTILLYGCNYFILRRFLQKYNPYNIEKVNSWLVFSVGNIFLLFPLPFFIHYIPFLVKLGVAWTW